MLRRRGYWIFRRFSGLGIESFMLRRRGYWIFRRFSGLGIGSFRRRGCRILGFLDKDLDHIGEEAIGFYGFSSFLDRGMTCILGFPFPD
jgi:hypothetical protein